VATDTIADHVGLDTIPLSIQPEALLAATSPKEALQVVLEHLNASNKVASDQVDQTDHADHVKMRAIAFNFAMNISNLRSALIQALSQ
jgi:hypothetical protein